MTHVADVEVQSSQVPSDQTDFVVFVDLNDLPSSFWDTVANGGGDIRCYKSDGTTQLAREVVSCDTATDTGVLHVKFAGTLSSSSNTTIQIHADGSSSEPAADSTYGSEAVWSGLSLVSHTGETDSVGNSTQSERNVTAGNATGPLGDATSFNGTNQALGFSQVSSDLSGGTQFAFRGWVNFDSMASGAIFAIWLDSSTYQVLIAPTDGDEILVAIGTGAGQVRIEKTTTANLSTGTDYLLEVALVGATDVRVYINGTSYPTSVVVNNPVTTIRTVSETMGVGGRWTQNNDYCDVTVSEILVSTSARSADWIKTEHNNQSSPGTFYTVTAVGGGATDISAGVQQIAVTNPEADVSLSVNIAAQLTAIFAETFQSDVSLNATIGAGVESLTLTAQPAGVENAASVSVALSEIAVQPFAAGVTADTSIAMQLAAVTLAADPGQVLTGSQIGAALAELQATDQPATVTLNVAIAGSLASVSLETLAAAVGLNQNIAAAVASMEVVDNGVVLSLANAYAPALHSAELSLFSAEVTGTVGVLLAPGLEFTMPAGRLHYALPINRIHFTFTDED